LRKNNLLAQAQSTGHRHRARHRRKVINLILAFPCSLQNFRYSPNIIRIGVDMYYLRIAWFKSEKVGFVVISEDYFKAVNAC
jgi:hypothetical protein